MHQDPVESRPVWWRRLWIVALVVALTAGLAACGDDDDDSDAADTTTTSAAEPTAAELAEYCAIAEELAGNDAFPTAEQLGSYQELAPAEIADEAETAAGQLIAASDDPVAQFNAFAADDVEAAITTLNAYETDQCDIDHSDDALPPAQEIDADAARVDVTATEYSFTFDEPIAAGPTSFVLVSEGAQAHFLSLFKLGEGVTLEEALSEDSAEYEDTGTSALAAAGGEDEEVINADLEPGTYGMACFLPDPDGKSHAEKGMTAEFTVAG